MSMRLTVALNGALNAPRRKARRRQPETSESSGSGDEVDILLTAEPGQASWSKEMSMLPARPTSDHGGEEVTNGAGL
ncbi:hypothetical protein RRF57_010676 [Xylaria bambusicola]|uniref:Uncharacterized protein n=1 Tax=Xylaria bambusicola TaxID=326684 RepID=A0AAN7V1Q1_9PEZI